MRLIRWSGRSLLATVIMFPLPVVPAQALERNLFTWSGTIDREVIIVMRGRQIETRGSGLDASYSPRYNVREPLPQIGGEIRAWLESGRGEVDVLEHPSSRNNYAAVVRVRDLRGGADQYQVIVAFQAEGDNAWNREGGGRGRGNSEPDRGRGNDGRGNDGRGNDGRWDDRRDNDNGRDNDRWNDRWNDRGRREAGRLNWGGLVDDVAEIRIQGRRVEYFTRSGAPLRAVRFSFDGAGLPRRNVHVELGREFGRGRMWVAQQPTARNGFVAVIRIDDSRGGYGEYFFDARW